MPLEILKKDKRYIITGTTSTSQEITKDQVFIEAVLWEGVPTAAHKLALRDSDGDLVVAWSADAPGTNGEITNTITFPSGRHPCKGLKIDDMDSGTLIIYLAP